jgi:hypothetical protein
MPALTLAVALPLSLTLAAACDTAAAPPALPPREACALAVVTSDYRSTAVSLLTGDGSLCAPDVLTSGSRPPGLLTALSGDVVLPSAPAPSALLHVIDRYPNAVVTSVDPLTSAVVSQLAVSPGYAGNPQDIAFVGADQLVARLERSPDDPNQGSDLLLVTPGASSRIDLSAHADRGFDPMPTRFARAAGRLWIGLTHLARDFSAAAPGRALALAPDDLAVTHTLDLAPFQNCGTLAAATPEGGLWSVCSGLFRKSPTGPQRAHSGLAYLAPELPTSALVPTWSLAAADLHPEGLEGRPLGFTLAALDDQRAMVVALGDLETELPDRLLLVDRVTGRVEVLAESGPFELGAVLPRPLERVILVADADPRRPRVRRFEWPTAGAPARELPAIEASPSGLPPRHLAAYR